MNTEETLTQLALNLAPDEVAEFACNTPAEAKAWYMRYKRTMEKIPFLSESLTISRVGKTLRITRFSPPTPPIIKKLSELQED